MAPERPLIFVACKILFALLCQLCKERSVFNKVNKYGNNKNRTWKKHSKFLALIAGSHSSESENILFRSVVKEAPPFHFNEQEKHHGINSNST